MNKKPKRVRPSGAAHITNSGKVAILIGLAADEIAILDAACKLDGRSRVGFLRRYAIPEAIRAAKKILEKNSKIIQNDLDA